MNDRIKYLRKEILKKNQDEFGNMIGISRSNVANIEVGRINITDRVISDICSQFNVNENWLRTGEGELFNKTTPDEELAYFMGKLLSNDDETPKKKFFRAMSKLPDEWFLQLYNAVINESKKNE